MKDDNELIIKRLESLIIELQKRGHQISSINQLIVGLKKSRSTASKYATGNMSITYKLALEIQEHYGVNSNYILYGYVPMFLDEPMVVEEPIEKYNDCESKLEDLQKELAEKDKIIDLLKGQISDKEKIITFLESK